ncbi:hypothetical protein CAPTEDRAFT_179917 [Capitella teleta]|uniref:Major facilitator superfamily (MFS) profile domain-containing protein n=1 Tax=Capitella teleta TaxID=283909 RepID=R7UVB0_CAPTE|nr:hypothetical protein CAPTEDRAFT_179917 [Capitella teleta]|eukprot:ELU07902.1 hypothetical protein CAPTEDRAFT_179917 [Capitella teleta]
MKLPPDQLEILIQDDKAAEYKEVCKEDSDDSDASSTESEIQCSSHRAFFTLTIMLFANLLNYMDRYTIAGVLVKVKSYYRLESEAQAGLLQTAFILSYMVLSPVFGFLGDRFSRKAIMAVGILFWSLITLAGSFVPADKFWLFLLMRALVGVGEASYSTIAPTIIADLFVKTQRTKALSVFYFAIPVGSGLGYIVGSNVAEAMGSWQWSLRVTPVLGIICTALICLVVREPPRGAAEGGTHLHSTSWAADLKHLFKHKTFLLSTAGFTCVAFVAGALALWAPTYVYYSIMVQPNNLLPSNEVEAHVSLVFGIVTCVAGFVGVTLGSSLAAYLRPRVKNADPLVCGFGLIASAPFLFLSIYMSRINTAATWVFIFIGETFLSLNWALVTDILLAVIIPTRRSTAEAVQILVSHALGDAGSPYLVGAMSDMFAKARGNSGFLFEDYITLQYSMYACCFVCVLGGGFFLTCAIFFDFDRKTANLAIKGNVAPSCAPDINLSRLFRFGTYSERNKQCIKRDHRRVIRSIHESNRSATSSS